MLFSMTFNCNNSVFIECILYTNHICYLINGHIGSVWMLLPSPFTGEQMGSVSLSRVTANKCCGPDLSHGLSPKAKLLLTVLLLFIIHMVPLYHPFSLEENISGIHHKSQ